MLDIKFIRENQDLIKQNIQNRHVKLDLEQLLQKDEQRREIQQELNKLQQERNQGSKLQGKPSPEHIQKMKELGQTVKNKEEELQKIEIEFQDLMLQVPNITHPKTPIGHEDQFKILYTNQVPEIKDFPVKDHEELLLKHDLLDFERGAKVVGSKFYYTKNELVELNRALTSYGIDICKKHGFQLIETPDLAHKKILEGAGFNPRGEETQIYNIENQDLSLVGTAEITILGYHSNETLDLENGPIKYVALSHCFRTEAGSYGRTSKGLYRVHQFTKLEMFVFCKPDQSDQIHQDLLAIEQEIVDGLEVPYRVIDIASADLGGPAYRKFDIEAYMTMLGDPENPSELEQQGDYGEITSTSNCLDYQSRRLNIRYDNKETGKKDYVHTLNGTAVVLSRFPITLIENHQQKDGSIKIPKALHKYLSFTEIK
jgi:seryl-tRNA synthetase